jgi:hypothetical protein
MSLRLSLSTSGFLDVHTSGAVALKDNLFTGAKGLAGRLRQSERDKILQEPCNKYKKVFKEQYPVEIEVFIPG